MDKIFHMGDMDGRYLDRQLWEGHGLPQVHMSLQPVPQGEFKPSFSKRYTVNNYAQGDFISYYDWEDDQYGVIAKVLPKKGGSLAKAHATLKERVVADWFKNVAFAAAGNSTTGMSDGRPYFDTAHPVSASNTGVTYANRPATEADLSISSYQAGANNLRQQFAANDVTIIDNSPRLLVVNPDQGYLAKQILRGEWERGSANLNTNYIRDDNVDLLQWAYFRTSGSTGTRNAWMLFGQEHELYFFERQAVKTMMDWVINVLAYEFVSFSRFTWGADDWRGGYGSKGT